MSEDSVLDTVSALGLGPDVRAAAMDLITVRGGTELTLALLKEVLGTAATLGLSPSTLVTVLKRAQFVRPSATPRVAARAAVLSTCDDSLTRTAIDALVEDLDDDELKAAKTEEGYLGRNVGGPFIADPWHAAVATLWRGFTLFAGPGSTTHSAICHVVGSIRKMVARYHALGLPHVDTATLLATCVSLALKFHLWRRAPVLGTINSQIIWGVMENTCLAAVPLPAIFELERVILSDMDMLMFVTPSK